MPMRRDEPAQLIWKGTGKSGALLLLVLLFSLYGCVDSMYK